MATVLEIAGISVEIPCFFPLDPKDITKLLAVSFSFIIKVPVLGIVPLPSPRAGERPFKMVFGEDFKIFDELDSPPRQDIRKSIMNFDNFHKARLPRLTMSTLLGCYLACQNQPLAHKGQLDGNLLIKLPSEIAILERLRESFGRGIKTGWDTTCEILQARTSPPPLPSPGTSAPPSGPDPLSKVDTFFDNIERKGPPSPLKPPMR